MQTLHMKVPPLPESFSLYILKLYMTTQIPK